MSLSGGAQAGFTLKLPPNVSGRQQSQSQPDIAPGWGVETRNLEI